MLMLIVERLAVALALSQTGCLHYLDGTGAVSTLQTDHTDSGQKLDGTYTLHVLDRWHRRGQRVHDKRFQQSLRMCMCKSVL